ncbi:hypothetical protein QK908_07895 [Lactococcus cremoris]
MIFFESLFAIKKNNYRTDDVVNLLKSKVYTDVNLDEEVIDYFEYYVQKYKISGRKKFTEEFIESEFSQIELVNEMRKNYLEVNSFTSILGNNDKKQEKNGFLIYKVYLKMKCNGKYECLFFRCRITK